MPIADLDWKTLLIAFAICVVFVALLSSLLNRRRRPKGPREKELAKIDAHNLDAAWCVVANVAPQDEPPTEDTLRFADGTKVYCLPWKQTRKAIKQIEVIGRQSDSPKMINVVMKSDALTDIRLERVYQPGVLQRLAATNKASKGDPNLWGDEDGAQAALDSLLGVPATEESGR